MNFIGVELAWTPSGGTGLCLIADGRAVESTRLSTDEEILAWLRPLVADGSVVAIDAPLIVRNLTGRRRGDQLISQCFGAQNGVRGERIAAALELDVDPGFEPRIFVRRAIEVSPHPAIVALFDLSVTLKYKAKPGRTLESRSGELSLLVRRRGMRPSGACRSIAWRGTAGGGQGPPPVVSARAAEFQATPRCSKPRSTDVLSVWGEAWWKVKNLPRAAGFETGATGLEPATSGVTGRRSNQLNYAPRARGQSSCPGI